MALLVFDTHDFITELTDAGIPHDHAKAISDGLRKADLAYVATRDDIASIKIDIANLRTELKGDTQAARSSLLQWFMGMMIGQAGLFAALVELLK